ncbi:MAG TPA: hypothetical protein VNI54_11150 [Thermoanaerobaculia bacterium]|nr:hypothetical protein [Thermoanaerobaculia bacterium]
MLHPKAALQGAAFFAPVVYFNARAQWDLFGEDGKISDPLRLSEAVVLPVTVE